VSEYKLAGLRIVLQTQISIESQSSI